MKMLMADENNMKLNFQNPQFPPDNVNNPYTGQVVNQEEGRTYFPAPESNSTMVSDSVIMTERLKRFVPSSSVKKGRKPIVPEVNGVDFREEDNQGNNYKSLYQ